MVRKRKKQEEEKPWCFYCDREFNDENDLILHQKNKHFKCGVCNKRLVSAKALTVHSLQVHKVTVHTIPDSKDGREDPSWEIFGSQGIPPGMKRGENPPKAVPAPQLPPSSHGMPPPRPPYGGPPPYGAPPQYRPQAPYYPQGPPMPPYGMPPPPYGARPPMGMGPPHFAPRPGYGPPPPHMYPHPGGPGLPPVGPGGMPPPRPGYASGYASGPMPPSLPPHAHPMSLDGHYHRPPYGAPYHPPGAHILPPPSGPPPDIRPPPGHGPPPPSVPPPVAAASSVPLSGPPTALATTVEAPLQPAVLPISGDGIEMVWKDEEVSMEERRASLPKYTTHAAAGGIV